MPLILAHQLHLFVAAWAVTFNRGLFILLILAMDGGQDRRLRRQGMFCSSCLAECSVFTCCILGGKKRQYAATSYPLHAASVSSLRGCHGLQVAGPSSATQALRQDFGTRFELLATRPLIALYFVSAATPGCLTPRRSDARAHVVARHLVKNGACLILSLQLRAAARKPTPSCAVMLVVWGVVKSSDAPSPPWPAQLKREDRLQLDSHMGFVPIWHRQLQRHRTSGAC